MIANFVKWTSVIKKTDWVMVRKGQDNTIHLYLHFCLSVACSVHINFIGYFQFL